MVNFTSTLIDAPRARIDRYRPAPMISPMPANRLVDVEPRPISPDLAAVMGEVCPDADNWRVVVTSDKAQLAWHQGTTDTAVFGTGFATVSDDIQTRVGSPPPPCRPSA